MNRKTVSRRQRLVRVREAQHAMAVAETMRAREQVDSIAHNAQRLHNVRSELYRADPRQMGGTFAAYRELADRLERAGRQLDGALYDARKVVDQKQGIEVAANRDREIAVRLKERAHADAEERQEARLAAIPRYRTMQQRGQE
ncbi:MAG: hypothetical protein EP321_01505 [Sphingomonadales bacterium]|nr:MAG: hypothetical protein EP345_06790 [Sphingomonadales bacterium]TNF06047.1 MAG: hypothetical protein EP321_01505 [Sphingomonadales bacterium]